FNTLQQSGRALVIASDRAPRDLPGMDERIRTRLAAGMVAQVSSPELELRIAILQSKLLRDQAGHMVPLNVLEYIAQCVTSSVRALEGALVRLLAMAGVSGEPITIDLAKDALIDIADNAPVAPLAVYGHTIRPIPPHKLVGILQDVLEETLHIDRVALVGSRRDRPTVQARHIAMYLMRDMTGASLAAIGDVFGGKDHTSVRHACEKVQLAMNTETAYMQQVQQLRNKVTLRLTSQSMA
ncbi:MAG: chromosomal replication initiator protein DnaA, partial [Armatimonadota bacterium]